MLNRFLTLGCWARVAWLCALLVCWCAPATALAAGGAGGTGTSGFGGSGGSGGAFSAGTGGSGGSASTLDAPVVREVRTALKPTPTEVMRGGAVTLSGENLPADKDDTFIWLDGFSAGHPLAVSDDRKSLVFVVPEMAATSAGANDNELQLLPARRYVLSFSVGAEGRRIAAGILRITPEKLPPLRLEGMSPTIVYPDTQQIVLTGDGMGGRMRDYSLLVDGTEIQLCLAEELTSECQGAGDKPDGCCKGLKARFVSDHQLEIFGSTKGDGDGNAATLGKFRDASGQVLSGDHTIGLRAGDTLSTKTFKVAFSSHSTSMIRYTALLIALLLLAGMVALVVFGGSKHYVGSREFVGKAFLIDTETDTYSLSKLQFYLWSTAALFAYAYLSLSRCLVQGKLDIADIPENLPSILGLSAGTAITSIGIAKIRGPKAAGVIHPRFGDLLSSGGVVSPERFTYLLWTIVAIATFLLNVWNVDSMVLNDLPKIPQGLLALSGLSSAAYLGGKFARGAGPVVDEVLPTTLPPNTAPPVASPPVASPPVTALLLMGRNLAIDATFEVEGQSITPLLVPEFHKDRRAIAGKREDGDRAASYAKSLTIVLATLPEAWSEALSREPDPNHLIKLTVANPDGQRAEVEVPRTALQKPPA